MSQSNGQTRIATGTLRDATDFLLTPDAGARAALADDLGVLAVRKLRFAGTITPEGDDLTLAAELGATLTQACVVTFAPVTTRIDERVTRRYLSHMPPVPEGEEVEMPEDDSAEPLPAVIDLEEVMREALALALPAFPRADGVDPVEISVSEPGVTPLSDDDAKPFAGLRALKDKMDDEGGERG